ncbi:arylsulfatase A-like enzyme [Streptosporangium becharense]|uniref:Arylsulfatase A-like enzyme n=1 Tax=Streptosporangium becharense TaxID=1816182 RepID=A0A7W9MIT3_9ACTN|nr:sulfatase [Streptosporangium becharense]MBB2910976.1 arylsulfatase A-like enzyme [Streptosporangium becharense]MBB5821966.1 arylsulfatase A-like enzyme [Streptosporangium becharense]
MPNALRKLLSLVSLLALVVPGTVMTVAYAAERPNIVFILADDLEAGDLRNFPNIHNLLVRGGTGFNQFFTTNSWCCPSRASILRSQYVHSHGVLTNTAPEGGFTRFHLSALERSTIGTWMQSAGYRTGLMGKYLNHYPGGAAEPTYVPPGWNEWDVPVRNLYGEYDYTLNENGVLRAYGSLPHDYLTDVLSQKARAFVSQPGGDPFFLYLAPVAPHNPANHALRHSAAFADAVAPRPPSFNRQDVADEPLWLRSLPLLGPRAIEKLDERHRRRLRAMLGVDDMVGALVETLRTSGKLDDTYIFFGSDNGFHLGQHRLAQGKTTPFDESIRVPLLVRGPGVRPGHVAGDLAATVDLAPTFAEIAGTRPPDFAEGRSLLPILRGTTPPSWRRNVLLEFNRPTDPSSARQTPVPPYQGMRTERHTFVRYATGEYQLYDLAADPYQLRNLAARVPFPVIAEFERQLDALVSCAGAGCRSADSVTPPALPAIPVPPVAPVSPTAPVVPTP